jgi:hypothetical protein
MAVLAAVLVSLTLDESATDEGDMHAYADKLGGRVYFPLQVDHHCDVLGFLRVLGDVPPDRLRSTIQ